MTAPRPSPRALALVTFASIVTTVALVLALTGHTTIAAIAAAVAAASALTVIRHLVRVLGGRS